MNHRFTTTKMQPYKVKDNKTSEFIKDPKERYWLTKKECKALARALNSQYGWAYSGSINI